MTDSWLFDPYCLVQSDPSVKCTLCQGHTLNTLYCSLHTTHNTLHYSVHTTHSILYTVHFTPQTQHSTLITTRHTLKTLHSTLFTTLHTLYTVHYTQHTWTIFAFHYTPHTKHSTRFTKRHTRWRREPGTSIKYSGFTRPGWGVTVLCLHCATWPGRGPCMAETVWAGNRERFLVLFGNG